MIWKISYFNDSELVSIFVKANSLDEALEIARKSNKRFNIGQLIEKGDELNEE